MDFRETAKKYIEEQGKVNCYTCGKDLYSCDDFECSKSGKKYVFIHKYCLKLRGEKMAKITVPITISGVDFVIKMLKEFNDRFEFENDVSEEFKDGFNFCKKCNDYVA